MTENNSDAGCVVFIAGPTASGKSGTALALAEACGGEIVNADAIQVYADLAVLSARPGPEALSCAPHHLYGTIDGATRCSAGQWARDAAAIIAEITARGKTAVVVGGTGLYFRALEEGLSPIPDAPPAIRAEAAAHYNAVGGEAFRAEVLRQAPGLSWIPAGDRQRLMRAWEVFAATGAPLTAFQDLPRAPLIAGVAARLVIEPARAALYAACEMRFDHMMAAGALEEAMRLRARGLAPDLPVMKALGAAELLAHLGGALDLETAIALAKQNTRRFAKRQLTWFRNQAPDWPRAVDSTEALALLLPQVDATTRA